MPSLVLAVEHECHRAVFNDFASDIAGVVKVLVHESADEHLALEIFVVDNVGQ